MRPPLTVRETGEAESEPNELGACLLALPTTGDAYKGTPNRPPLIRYVDPPWCGCMCGVVQQNHGPL
ncbi:MAG: hypothetical protein QOF51_3642 [Chloroflexota bacterium]|jgi:hypothetical protein|nr:hypothetical protein [Chloroflexota bacterium]